LRRRPRDIGRGQIHGMGDATFIHMKTSLLPVLFLSVTLGISATPLARADGLQKDTPGAQGTEGTDPTRQDSNVTGPNGQHSTNTNPADWPRPAHHAKPRVSAPSVTTRSSS